MTMYELKCSKCDTIKTYTNKRSWYNARRCKSQCKPCQNKESSTYWKGRTKPNYPKKTNGKTTDGDWDRNCPDCNKVLYYSSKWGRDDAERNGRICNQCSAYKYKKSWNNVITDDHIKKMRATKAGFTSWEEYKQKYPSKKMYQNEVRRLTRKQPLHILPNYSKLEENWGKMGEDGAYQIDHIISINKGWKDMIPAEEIANITNLQVMKWEDNLRKH